MNKILLLFSLSLCIVFCACTGEEPAEEGTASLIVKVTQVDNSNAIMANVDLFESQLDYQNQSNAIATLQTDNLGEVYFTNLELKQYWFSAKLGNNTNKNSVFSTGRALTKDERMEKITQLRP
ncbi:MAG: hypothetical protein JXQ87_07180 [Bacteroidia bacterium]